MCIRDSPKGGIEKNELIIEAAQREVKEETGVADLIVIDKIGETYHIFNNGKNYRYLIKHSNSISKNQALYLFQMDKEILCLRNQMLAYQQ